MYDLQEVKKRITRNGRLDESDVELLRDILYSDGGINKDKCSFLFDLKDTVSKDKLNEGFRPLFISALTSLLTEDENSPGEIDDAEAKWLRAKIQSKGYMDDIDEKLLKNLRRKSINYPDILNYKSVAARFFEHTLYLSRYLTILAVVGSIVSAVALFVKSTMVVINSLIEFIETFGQTTDYEELLADFVSSVDIYLFAMVLIIFGMGVYELFINKIDPVEKRMDKRPSWLQISSIDDLKSSLGKVILMAMVVSFFKYTLRITPDNGKELLFLAIGVLLIAVSLYIAQSTKHGKKVKGE